MAIRYIKTEDTLADAVKVAPVPWNDMAPQYQRSDLIDIEYLATAFSRDQSVSKGCGHAE